MIGSLAGVTLILAAGCQSQTSEGDAVKASASARNDAAPAKRRNVPSRNRQDAISATRSVSPVRVEAQDGAGDESARPLMESLRWRRRVLILFAPDESDPELQGQKRGLLAESEGLRARRLTVVTVFLGEAEAGADARGARDGAAITSVDARSLVERFSPQPDRLTVVLIGKDGGEKDRTAGVMSVDRLFSTIDAMPMRRAEMRRRSAD